MLEPQHLRRMVQQQFRRNFRQNVRLPTCSTTFQHLKLGYIKVYIYILVCGFQHVLLSIIYGINPSHWLSLHHFSRWWNCTTNQYIIVYIYIIIYIYMKYTWYTQYTYGIGQVNHLKSQCSWLNSPESSFHGLNRRCAARGRNTPTWGTYVVTIAACGQAAKGLFKAQKMGSSRSFFAKEIDDLWRFHQEKMWVNIEKPRKL